MRLRDGARDRRLRQRHDGRRQDQRGQREMIFTLELETAGCVYG